LRERLAALGLENHRGELYYRLVGEGERLSLPLQDVLAVFADGDPPLDVGIVARQVKTPGRTAARRGERAGREEIVTVSIENRSREPTALALVDTNYVELVITNGTFGSVELGSFVRMELSQFGRRAQSMRAIREANVLRLHYPLLEPGALVESGGISLLHESADSELLAGARFLFPDGRELEVQPAPIELAEE
jgi:hypothetical protein